MSHRSYSIIILNWNGRDLLERGLPSVMTAAKATDVAGEIIVVDNGSLDHSVEYVHSNFPSVRVIALDKNYGFGGGNNIGVQQATGDVVIILNNDMVVDKDFITPLLKPFEEDKQVFAVGCQIYFQDRTKRREETGKTFAYWDKGIIRYLHQDITSLDCERKYIPIFWASGGAAAFDRRRFLELGGFREIYSPAYAEDTDLSYRAWKRGWKVLVATNSVVYHKHRTTSSKRFTESDLEILTRRNHLFFLWSNISSWKMFMEHLFFHLLRLLKYSIKDKERIEWKALIQALPCFIKARRLNKKDRRFEEKSDEEILRGFAWKKDFLKNQKRLSILFVCPYVPCRGIHATGTRMYHVAHELSKMHDVSILTYIEKPEEEKYANELRSFCKLVKTFQRSRTEQEPDFFHIKPNLVIKEFCSSDMKEEIISQVLSGRYDVVQFEFLQVAYWGRLIRHLGIPLTWVDHEVQHAALWKEFIMEKFWRWRKIELFFRWMVMLSFEMQVAKLFDMTITVTTNDEDEVRRYLPKLRTAVVPLGVDLQYFSDNGEHREEDDRLIFTGYFLHYPNVDAVRFFVKTVLPLIQEEISHVKFDIVGANPPHEVASLADHRAINVTGWVQDLRPYLQRAAVYVAPLRLGVGIRGKILEALAMGKAVVATSLAVRGIPVRDQKEVLISDDPRTFAEYVINLLNNKAVRHKLGKCGRETIKQNFSWESITQRNELALFDAINSR